MGEEGADFVGRESSAGSVVGNLVVGNRSDEEVGSLGMGEVESADGRRWLHGSILSKSDADFIETYERVEREGEFLVRERWIAYRRTDARVMPTEHISRGDILFSGISPKLAAHTGVEVFRGSFGKSVSETLKKQ